MSDDPALATQPRRGRRPGVSDTRQAILDSARASFAADGYAGTTVRRIALDAGVDPSLVFQFFRSKEELFAAVMSIGPTALERFAKAFEAPTPELGESIVRAFLQIWDTSGPDSQPMLAMLRGAIANERATEQLRGFIEARLLEDVRSAHEPLPDVRARVGVVSSMLVGLIVGRRIVQVPTLVAMTTEELVAVAGPAVQAVLTGRTSSVPLPAAR